MSDTTEPAGFATLAIHAGAQPDLARHALPPFPVCGEAALDECCSPAAAMLEERIAALEGGTATVAVASGRAARLLACQVLLRPGDEIVVGKAPADTSNGPLDAACAAFGWRVRHVDPDEPESVAAALSERTRAILVDSFAAPGGRVTDIEEIAPIARRARVPLVVDNSYATAYLVRPFEHGADIVLYTASGPIGGRADTRCGLIVDGGSFPFADDPRYPVLSRPSAAHDGLVVAETYGNFAFAMGARLGLRDLGGPPSPLAAYLVAVGLETLALRMQRQCDGAVAVARHLARHPKVAWVRYAGLERDAGHALAERYCPKGAGAGLAFGLDDAGAAAMIDRLRLFSRATDIGGARSLVLGGATQAVHLSIGLEDIADIVADLDQALA